MGDSYHFRNFCAVWPVLAACALSVSAGTLEWATVGDPGNEADFTGFGTVDYVFRIGKYEITNAQYADYLNAVAQDDPNGLYNLQMESVPYGGISRSGAAGDYRYSTLPGRAQKPVAFVSFWDALRFVNWLQNGRPVGAQGPATTEDGTYALTGDALASNQIQRREGAAYFLPDADEWHKSAYYKGGGVDAGYWFYPTSSDDPPEPSVPPGGPNSANSASAVKDVTDVGSYVSSPGPYGTYDQAGNLLEWTETRFDECCRVLRGGSWHYRHPLMSAPLRDDINPTAESSNFGFRVAAVPEPALQLLHLLWIPLAVRFARRGC